MKLTPEDIVKIRVSSKYKTDAELAEELGVSPDTIRHHRKKMGIVKSSAQIRKARHVDSNILKKELFFEDFKNSKQYELLLQTFTKDEVEYYMEEYWLHIQEIEAEGEELHASEKRTLDHLIQTKIRINRFTARESQLLKEIEKVESAKAKAELHKKLTEVSREIRELQHLHVKLQNELELTRQTRRKKHASTKINLYTILEELQNEKLKLGIGYWCALTSSVVKSILNKWRKEGILLDEKSADTSSE